MRTCNLCGESVSDCAPCPRCLEVLPNKPKPSTKSGRQQEVETILTNPHGAEVPWPILKMRIGKIMGLNPEESEVLDDNALRYPEITIT